MDELLNYYRSCFELMDTIHFNSELTRGEYEKVLGEGVGKTVPISHGGIGDNRSLKKFSERGLVVGFIGNDTPYKGLQVLARAVEGLDVDVMVWGGKKMEDGRIHYRGKFRNGQLPEVYREMDLLVVPSIWKETFSLVTLEALSFGVPVLVSDNVGAQDVVREYMPEFVYSSEKGLRSMLETLTGCKTLLEEYNRRICEQPWKHDERSHAEEIVREIYENR